MKRDIGLIKEILIEIEESNAPSDIIEIDIPDRSQEEISYHIMLMYQAGLLEADDVSGTNSYKWIPISLTWHGHEFLDAVRNDTVWSALTKKLKEQGGNVPFEVIQRWLTKLSVDLLG